MGIIETFRQGSSPMQPIQAADYLCAMATQWRHHGSALAT